MNKDLEEKEYDENRSRMAVFLLILCIVAITVTAFVYYFNLSDYLYVLTFHL